MKRYHTLLAPLAFFMATSFAVQAQGDKELPEKAQEGKPDFETTGVMVPEKKEKATQQTLIPNSYIVILNSEKHPSFTKGNRQFKSREEQGAAAEKFEEVEKRKILALAKAKYKVEESDITAVFTGGFTGFGVIIHESPAKAFMEQAKNDPDIETFFQDFEVSVDAQLIEEVPAEALLAQTVPWGVAFTGWVNNPNMGKWAWVLDTGIQTGHPDLNVQTNSTYARSFISGQSVEDGHGHGTHVAGTIAARNNTIGVVGVAANGVVVPVKVLSNSGSSGFSSVLDGVNHVYKYSIAGDVANLSLGGWGWSPFTESALVDLGKKGVRVAIAAGNSNDDAGWYTPARTNGTNVYTISAMDSYCNLTNFSNYGNPPVDFAAPGKTILSTYKGSAYAYMDGTSMAAPHVAGIMLANNAGPKTGGCCSGYVCKDKDSNKDRVAKR